ncbi:hypothetical protein Hypma_002342 [Hypsizygus marmoreus]|uniref:Uncharacterized protein n=1 Tax=Hypsizygus marmoreus TaxID=39966 RepID=A0A369J3N0_HYPMA|nr:hypothetical protein Hypma_002342 [Hypsizygus marmoreus]
MSDGDSSFHLGSTSSFGIEPSQLDQEIREQRERKRKRSNSDLEVQGSFECTISSTQAPRPSASKASTNIRIVYAPGGPLDSQTSSQDFVDSLLAQAEQDGKQLAALSCCALLSLRRSLILFVMERDQAYQERDKAIMERDEWQKTASHIISLLQVKL